MAVITESNAGTEQTPENIRAKVNKAADQFHTSTGIEVSGQARNVIHYIVSAVKTDPHPTWSYVPSRDVFTDSLPKHFSDIVKEERVKKRITTHDFLHWLSGNLERVCPIEKPRREGAR